MASFTTIKAKHYLQSLDVFRKKSGQNMNVVETLKVHIPPIIQRMLPMVESQQFNILSVGSGEGEIDMTILKVIKEELQKSEHGRHMKIFNRAIEPNEDSCGIYKTAIENLPSSLDDQKTDFEVFQQTFEEYQESQKEPIRFDIVHFIHSIYYVDVEQVLFRCFEKDLKDKGHFICIVSDQDLVHRVLSKQRKQWQDENVAKKSYKRAKKLIQIANENGWKHELYTREYLTDVTEVFDPRSTDGNLLLDFLTHTVNFRETADKQLVEETLDFIKDLTIVKDEKRFGEKKDSLVVIYKK